MANDDSNLRAAAWAAGWALATGLALVVVLAMPEPIRLPPKLGWAVPAGGGLAVLLLLRLAHRVRIRAWIEAGGARVVRLRRLPFWRQYPFALLAPRLSRRFEVEFVDLFGEVYRGICWSGLLTGVRWESPGPRSVGPWQRENELELDH